MALEEKWERKLPYEPTKLVEKAVVYSDAESHGSVATVVIYQNVIWYQAGMIPDSITRRLQPRKTQIVAFELLAAIMAVLLVAQILPPGVAIHNFIDNKRSRSCIVKTYSKQWDLNELTGCLWFRCGKLLQSYWSSYVRSNDNIADAPSRGKFHAMKLLKARKIELYFFAAISSG